MYVKATSINRSKNVFNKIVEKEEVREVCRVIRGSYSADILTSNFRSIEIYIEIIDKIKSV